MTSIPNRRAPEAMPFSAKCPLHLRRVCGVCAHFTAAKCRVTATCRLDGMRRPGGQDARDCEAWERKSAGQAG